MTPTATHSSRLEYLDFIRFAAMLFMLQGHTLDALVSPQILDIQIFPWNIWHGLRGQTAPMFLLLSGAVFSLSLRRKGDGKLPTDLSFRRIRWGLIIMALGYFLVFPASRLVDLQWLSSELWRQFCQINILQLNGAMLILLTLLASLLKSDRAFAWASLGFGMVILLLTPFIHAVSWTRFLPEMAAAYLSPSHGSLFPLFPYGAYMGLGAGLGVLLRLSPRKDETFLLACAWGTLLSSVLSLALSFLPQACFPPHDAYQGGPSFGFLRLALALGGFIGLFLAARHWPRISKALAPLGRYSLQVYVGHLVLLYGLPWMSGLSQMHARNLGWAQGMGYVVVVGSISFGGAACLELLHQKMQGISTMLRIALASFLTCALVF